MSALQIKPEQFEEEVVKSDKPVLVDFWASWCGPCKMLAPTIEQIANENDSIKVGKVNVDDEADLAQQYGIVSIPTVILFKNGEPGYPKLGDVIGRIEFDENCGAYIGKQTGCASFPSAYQADVNREYMRSFPITIRGNGSHAIWLEEGDVVNCGEYMVIRSRVKCDEHGKIVSANYSKILGSMGLTGRVGVEETVFNPRPNDTNLEFDPKRNLYQGKVGRGMIP